MFSGLDPLNNTALHVPFKQQLADAVQRSLDRRQLVEHIIAVSIPLDHALDAADLAFDPVEPGGKPALEFR
ncbi:hypothetical protein D3C74_379050 [compost metagenome]